MSNRLNRLRSHRGSTRREHDRLGGNGGRVRDDAGMTLTELLIASTLLVVLLTVVMISMNLVSTVTDNVSSQYAENDQALPALAPLQTLLRAEVEPAPATPVVGAPTPGFGLDTPATAEGSTADQISDIGNFSLTFYSNIGTAYNNVTSAGTTAGPAMLVAEEVDQSGQAVTFGTSQCNTSSPCSFQVREYLPEVDPQTGDSSCPVGNEPSTNVCQYNLSKYTLVTDAADVINDPSQQANGAPTEPIFTYDIFDPTNDQAFVLTPGEVQTGTIQLVANHNYPAGTPNVTLTGPTACAVANGTYPTCPADDIQSVGVDLMIGIKGSGTNGNVENQTIVYRYPESPGSPTYPYQYSSTAG